MKVTVRELILTNGNIYSPWKIDGEFYLKKEKIPEDLLNKYVSNWEANFWDNRVEITTLR